MDDFDPYTQNVTFLASDGKTKIEIPMAWVDAFQRESTSVSINYGTQLGACIIMLVTLLIMTPKAKFRRPSNILHVVGLALCSIRMLLLCLYFPSPFNDFYAFWANDYSHVPGHDFAISIAANTVSLLLVIGIEAALMNQAWTMVSLWPEVWKYGIVLASGLVTLLTIGWRLAFTVIQNKAVLSLSPPTDKYWLVHWMVVTNAVSICWFCAIFNIKLLWHLISNRGVLPSYKAMTPMEVLVMTNGMLMIVPVIFSGLEWGHFVNFEAASLTLTSVAIILPMGTLAAQRMSASNTSFSYSSADSSGRYGVAGTGTSTGGSSSAPLKASSFTTHRTAGAQVSILSRCEAGMSSRDRMNPAGLELDKYSSEPDLDGRHVRVERNLVQHEERL
ncbi:hypothetical protein FZEAL_9383 [Fusarium zealandicum]|uniref:Pheromone receptor n=1 Tax=Fusarium zealandicum TaxID=1053134 RepID=A0A8H4XGD3_9HYPO|nr:hypothetical protein FZEAL_9383 [Fusarium zealandicum]